MTDKADDESPIPQQATPRKVLESRLMDPRVAKSELEWYASREIERLKDKLHKLDQAFDALYEESSGQSIAEVMGVDSLRDQLTDKDATIASQAAEIERLRVRVAELDDGGYAAQRAAVAELTVKDQAAEIAMLQSIIDVLDENNVASAVRAALRGDRP